MTSAIDPTKPTSGHAFTADVRANFGAAKSEIEALQESAALLQESIAALQESLAALQQEQERIAANPRQSFAALMMRGAAVTSTKEAEA